MRKLIVQAPSNIAFVKYWGKSDAQHQWPANDSLSMTLSNCFTRTEVQTSDRADHFQLSGSPLESSHKVFRYIQFIKKEFEYEGFFDIKTENSFPSDCGIASSASGYCALGLGIMAEITGAHSLEDLEENVSKPRLSHLIRMGSGSACRSLYGPFVKWNRSNHWQEQSVEVIQSPWILKDYIVLIDPHPKSVSSSEAHKHCFSSPIFEQRLDGIGQKMIDVEGSIKQKKLGTLGKIIEDEALNMHEVSRTASPSIRYMSSVTHEFLEALEKFRTKDSIEVFYTMDAGPNPHLIVKPEDSALVEKWLTENWDFNFIEDQTGYGSKLWVES